MILFEWFMATEEPVDLQVRIREAQWQDPFMAARCQELDVDGRWETPCAYTDDLLRFLDHIYVP